MLTPIRTLLLWPQLTLLLGLSPVFAGSPEDAISIIDAARLTGGVVVHLGTENEEFTAALRQRDSIVVHGLVDRSDALAKARDYVSSKGLSGPVSFAVLTGKTLPYVDNSVNLVVATGPLPVTAEEVLRVLCPGGRLLLIDPGFWPPVRQLFNLALRIAPHAGDHRFHSAREARALVEGCRFTVSRVERVGIWAYLLVADRR